MMAFDAYRCYLSLKNHFTKDHYDYIKYRGKTRATKQAFYKRKDRFWFEKFARKKNDKEVEEFFVHPPILKSYLGGNTSLETMVIYDIIFEYGTNFDKQLNDPVWETVSRKIKKYKPFLNINVQRYTKILKEIVIHGS
jgi:hypothetical protein